MQQILRPIAFGVALALLLVGIVPTAESATTGANGYIVYTYYSNPNGEWVNAEGDRIKEVINSFDFGPDGALYYTTYIKNLDEPSVYKALVGFKVYRYDGESLEVIYSDPNAFGVSGGRVITIGNKVYFNDGSTAGDRSTFDYYCYDPEVSPPVKILDSTQDGAPNLWGLDTGDGTDFWAAGRLNYSTPPTRRQEIYYSSIENGDLMPVIDLGVGSYATGSGPLALDEDGNLYFADGGYGETHIWRFTASDVLAAIANPATNPLHPDKAYDFDTLRIPGVIRGASSMFIDGNLGMVLTATNYHDPSELRQYAINEDGTNGGYNVLATSDSRMAETRFENGEIYVSDPDGIYRLSGFVIDGCDTGVPDRQLSGGELLSEKIGSCAKIARNHGLFVSCATEVTNGARNAGSISGADEGAIQSCAAQASIPAD